ncbi:MAG: extracellular solute-binding protein [Chloroflexi bacterium]|nr:extracellular solute-binding protein [Chloroflexota bacterium]MXX82714.1 extracellular solute-binding protein [Chloroflexota bacterium]MYA93341.1 extracellular solute-binding protein [Chloroflexota bacterium]MYE78691.1 extracellular solute-binding protein [Chloroflexota bacterium]MYH66043.1 extracellular solute-binding protein [Chloroflexota bacterium]
MFKRLSLLLTVALLFAMLLLLSIPTSIVAQDAEPTPIVGAFGGGETKISYWNGLTGSDGVTMNEMLAQFAMENPEYEVTSEIIPWNTLYAKLQAAFVANQPPDLVLMHASEVPQFASFGVLMDLGPWYTSGGGWFDETDISTITYSGMQYQGVTYAIPLDNHGRGLWINTDMFEAAGIDTDPATAPDNYEDWVTLLQALTLDADGNNAADPDFDNENVVQWGYVVGEWPRVNFLSALAQHGGEMVSADEHVTVNSDAGVAALQQAVDLVYEYNVSPPPAGFDTWQGFASGSVAVIPTGTWFRNFAVDQTDINGMAWPQVQFGAQPATWFGIHAFMLPASSTPEKAAAVEALLQWISANQVTWAGSGQVPALLSAQAALDPVNYPSNILLGQSFSDYGILDYQSTAVQEMYAALDPELDAALNNLKSVEDALNDATERMQQVLDRAM